MKQKPLFSAIVLCLLCLTGSAGAQTLQQPTDSVGHGIVHRLGVDVRPGYVFPTHRFFDGDNAAGKPINTALGVHLKYAFQFSPNSRLGRLYPSAYQGIGVAYNTFFNSSEVGNPVALYAFQGARIARLTPALTLDYEWNFGASFGWKKYDENTNPYNTVVGSSINAYINAGFFLNWQMAPQWQLTAGIDLTHYSNGNTHYPNSGVNTVGTRIGVVRTFGHVAERVQRTTPQAESSRFSDRLGYDLVLYGATRKMLWWE